LWGVGTLSIETQISMKNTKYVGINSQGEFIYTQIVAGFVRENNKAI